MNDVIDLGRFDRSHSLPHGHHNHEFSDLKYRVWRCDVWDMDRFRCKKEEGRCKSRGLTE